MRCRGWVGDEPAVSVQRRRAGQGCWQWPGSEPPGPPSSSCPFSSSLPWLSSLLSLPSPLSPLPSLLRLRSGYASLSNSTELSVTRNSVAVVLRLIGFWKISLDFELECEMSQLRMWFWNFVEILVMFLLGIVEISGTLWNFKVCFVVWIFSCNEKWGCLRFVLFMGMCRNADFVLTSIGVVRFFRELFGFFFEMWSQELSGIF